MRILAIPGSLRAESYNRRLLAVIGAVGRSDLGFDLWGGLREVPPFDEDAEAGPAPGGVVELRRAIAGADAVLIATPEYNGSIPGVLKNALDWASRPYAANALRGKPVAVIGASPSPRGAARAQDDLRRVLRVIGANVIETDLTVIPSVRQSFDDEGNLCDGDLQHRLMMVLNQLLAHGDDGRLERAS